MTSMSQPKKYLPAEEAYVSADDKWEVEVCVTACFESLLSRQGARCEQGSVWCNVHQQITLVYSCCY